MSQWSSMLLHDLKNYLAPLHMVAANLQENRDSPDFARVCADDIQRVTDRMERLVRSLSELRSQPALRTEATSPNQLVREALTRLQIGAKPSVSVTLRLGAQQLVLGDPDMLPRVLDTIITNALEAMSDQGTLSITTEDDRAGDSPRVHIRVEDTGTGIPDEFIRERLFRPFATTKTKGLGLGLYQCRSIIRAYRGDITVRSQLGKGSLFAISLIAASRESEPPEHCRHSGAHTRRAVTGKQ